MNPKIEKYTSEDQAHAYLSFLEKVYGHHINFETYKTDVLTALQYCLQNPHQEVWLVTLGDNVGMLGHSSLILDSRLQKDEAFFGFFHCYPLEGVFDLLWGQTAALASQKRIKKLLGPVNGTIWHTYRVLKRRNESWPGFAFEPFGDVFQYQQFSKLTHAKEIGYYTGIRENFDMLIQLTRQSHQECMQAGFTIKQAEQIDAVLLKDMHQLSLEAFKGAWGFVPLEEESFFNIYKASKLRGFEKSPLYCIYKNSELVGYCATLCVENALVVKSLAVHPGFQGLGLGNALVYRLHKDAKEKGIYKMIYALIREGNKVKHFPTDDARVVAEYAAFEFVM